MALAQVSNQLLRSQGNDTTTVAANYPITGDGSTQLPLGLAEDYRGADGTSVTFEISAIPSGHRVTLSGAQGQESFDVMNGATGPSGAQGEQGEQGIQGIQGEQGIQGPAGQNGVDGVSPTFRFSEDENGVTVYVSGAQGEDSFRLYNATGGEGTTYSAGPYINIYPVEDQLYISADVSAGTPWLSGWKEIGSLSLNFGDSVQIVSSHDFSGYHNHSIGLKGAVVTLPSTAHIGSALDDKLDASSFSNFINTEYSTAKSDIYNSASYLMQNKLDNSASGNFYPMTGNPSGFLTAHQDLTNLDYVHNSALGYTPSTMISSISGHELYAESANHAFTAETANYVEGGWEYDENNNISSYNGSAFVGQNQATYDVKASSNINVTTAGNTFTVSGKDWTDEITAASAYAASQAQGKTYTGVAPIVVNNSEDKISANCIELSAGNGIDSNKLATGVIEVSGGLGGGVAISGQYNINGDTINVDCSAFGMFEQANSQGSYQLMATANNASWHSYGYTMSTSETVLMNNVSSIAQNYAASAVSSHVVPMAYSDITYSGVRDVIFNNGIVIPYETTQGYGTFYDFVGSAVADSTSSFTFRHIQTNGYCTTLIVSSYNYGATTGKVKNQSRIFLSPAESECKVVVVATSGDIPASGATDSKLYVVTGT